jgi:endoglucanase
MKSTLLVGAFAGAVTAQQGPWAQCGGIGYSGGTTCQSGWTCVVQNAYYSQCLQSTGGSNPTTTTTTTTIITSAKTTLQTTTKASPPPTTTTTITTATTSASASASPSASGKFKWMGVDESGAEFGQTAIPGIYGKDFTFASTSSIDVSSSLPHQLRLGLAG